MFGHRRSNSNVRSMQIFHELKQQFPAVPDSVVANCLSQKTHTSMGHPPSMENVTPNSSPAVRPTSLQLSEKCNDVPRLLNSPNKPPRPPRHILKNSNVKSPSEEVKISKETVSTPSQTTDTLLNNINPLNLSLNVNVVTTPTPKCTTSLQLTPTQPWLSPFPQIVESPSPRSFTSVNLTLRPPTSSPQDPIDITSQNSSLTYSTSSFDQKNGLQSRLQITVGPSGSGSVSSSRARPRSSYMGEEERPELPLRAGSLCDLAVVGSNSEAPVLLKQQARIDRMRIELKTEKARLVVMKEDVEKLERNRLDLGRLADLETEKQLLLEIKHLRYQCEQMALSSKEIADQFYNNIYTGPSGPLFTPLPSLRPRRRAPPPPRPASRPADPAREWSCHLCTFLNHPDLDKCEQCEMPRVLHGRAMNVCGSGTGGHGGTSGSVGSLQPTRPAPRVPGEVGMGRSRSFPAGAIAMDFLRQAIGQGSGSNSNNSSSGGADLIVNAEGK